MAAKDLSILHPAAVPETLEACRRAISRLGWEALEPADGSELRAEEPAGGLCCVVWPVTVEIALTAAGERETRIDVRATTPGWGPIQRRQLGDRLRSLLAAIADGG